MAALTGTAILDGSHPSQGRAWTGAVRQVWEMTQAAPILHGGALPRGRALTVPARAAALDSDGLRRGRAQAGIVRQVRAAARLDDRTSLRGHARTAGGAAWRC